jgi:hypothetical protein
MRMIDAYVICNHAFGVTGARLHPIALRETNHFVSYCIHIFDSRLQIVVKIRSQDS